MAHNKFNNDEVERAVRKRDRNETTENVGSGLKCNRQQSVDKMAYLKVMSLLYIAMQHRESDMRKFFCYENQPFPPSLSDQGKLHFVKKSICLKFRCMIFTVNLLILYSRLTP